MTLAREPDLAVNDREELAYLLTEAAEFEHTVMCTYLFAQWSLKDSEDEGVEADELEAIERWRASFRQVAREEMLHLALVNNILAAIGAAPHLWRPDFPVARGYFPADVDFHLAPFNEQSIEHFVFLERPEGIDLDDGLGFVHESRYPRVVCSNLLSPTPRDYQSQGHLYHGIAGAIRRLADRMGENALFVGRGEAQLGTAEFPLPGLFEVHDTASALQALEEIVLQGEGAPAHRDDSHFARFAAIRDEYQALRERRPEFQPARPVAVNPVLTEYAAAGRVVRIEDPLARQATDLGNAIYHLMLHALAQICAPAPLPAGLRQGMSEVASDLMRLLEVLGRACTRLPCEPAEGNCNAGITFALPRSFGPLVRSAAAAILAERAQELAAALGKLEKQLILGLSADVLERAASDLAALHRNYEAHFDAAAKAAVPSPERLAEASAPAAEVESDDVRDSGTASDSDNEAATDRLILRFEPSRCIHSRQCVLNAPKVFLANVEGPWLHPEADTPEHLAHVAQSCPSGAITYQRLDGGEEEPPPRVNTLFLRENGPYAVQATLALEGDSAKAGGSYYRMTLCRCGQSKNKPFCDNTHRETGFVASGEPATQPSEPLAERGGRLDVHAVKNGPLTLRGPLEICSGTGRTVSRLQSARLCRCGASANKPFCDGSHQRIGFTAD